jgi:hypothetical protein
MARTKQTECCSTNGRRRSGSPLRAQCRCCRRAQESAGVLLPEGFAVKSEKDGLKDAGEESEEVEEEGEEDEFVVKCILSEKIHQGKLTYKVLWASMRRRSQGASGAAGEQVYLEEWLQKKKDGVATTAAEEEEEVEEEEKEDDRSRCREMGRTHPAESQRRVRRRPAARGARCAAGPSCLG